MKLLFTSILVTVTALLFAQNPVFEPAHSIMDENAVASVNDMYFDEAATEYSVIEFSNEFNLNFKANPVFGDITISYQLNADAKVKLEVEKTDADSIVLFKGTQSTGPNSVLWDQEIESGKYTIRLIVGNKVQTKVVNLSY